MASAMTGGLTIATARHHETLRATNGAVTSAADRVTAHRAARTGGLTMHRPHATSMTSHANGTPKTTLGTHRSGHRWEGRVAGRHPAETTRHASLWAPAAARAVALRRRGHSGTTVAAAADILEDEAERLGEIMTLEMGKTLKGAKACRKLGELCFACARVVRAENRPHSASSSARGTTKAAETAKALEAHRIARKRLQAELAAETAAS